MQSRQPTTPFGRRSLTLAHVTAQMVASARQPDKVVHKWRIFRAICTARPALRVSERSLAVLNALLSFHPETTLAAEDDLIVFPSNEQLCLRTHGMPPSTLRRQLAALVDAGLYPSGKGQSQRQALRPEGQGRGDHTCIRLRSFPTRSACGRIRAHGRGDRGRSPCRPVSQGKDYPLPARHREDDRDRS